jgi:hypothetical protein
VFLQEPQCFFRNRSFSSGTVVFLQEPQFFEKLQCRHGSGRFGSEHIEEVSVFDGRAFTASLVC